MIYLASPYSHPDAAVRRERYEATCRHAVWMLRQGLPVYSPVVHSHPLAELGLPSDWGFWAEQDRDMLRHASALAVLRLPSWEESRGVAAEVEIAHAIGIPVWQEEPAA